MMFDVSTKARWVIDSWNSEFVGDLPKALTTAIAVHEAAIYIEAPFPAVPDNISERNVEQAMIDLTQTMLLAERHWDAKSRVVDHLAQAVLTQAAAAVPSILERLREKFSVSVSEYVAAASALPDDLAAESLVSAGGEVVDQFRLAKAREAELELFHAFVNDLQHIPGYSTSRLEPLASLLAPKTRTELRALIDASGKRQPGGLNPIYRKAIELDIEFRLSTPRESQELVDAINATPIERPKGMAFVSLR